MSDSGTKAALMRASAAVLGKLIMERQFQDDLPMVVASRLRALGVIKPDAMSAIISFGEGEDALKREVAVWHRVWSHGGLSLFLCPRCGGKAQILRLFDGSPQCCKCLKRQNIQFKIAYGSRARGEREAARAKRIEKLKAKLSGGPLRLKPLPGRTIARRRPLELSLRRALIVEREKFLQEVEKWRGPTPK